MANARVTRTYVEYVGSTDSARVRVTRTYVEVVRATGLPQPPVDCGDGPLNNGCILNDDTPLNCPNVCVPVPPVTARPFPTGVRLGCGDYRVFIQTVGGTEILAELVWQNLTFSRRLDEMSDATVDLAAEQDAECLAHLRNINPFYHELSIYRDGTEIWVGPITEPSYTYEGARIAARDLFQWFERRLLPVDRTFSGTDLTVIAQTYADDALDQDPSPNITIVASLSGIPGYRSVLAALKRRAADEIRELARTGLDFTAIGRTIHFGGEEIGTPELPQLTEDVLEIAEARLAGLSMANDIYVLGSSGGGVGSPTVGHDGGFATPLIQQTYSEPSIQDVSSADRAATTRLDLLRDPPFYITGRLLEDAPIAFSHLIPGARVHVGQQVGFRRISVDMRLLTVDVSVEARDDGVTDDIRISLEPRGTVITQ